MVSKVRDISLWTDGNFNTSSQTDTNVWLLHAVLLYMKPHGAYCFVVQIILLYCCPKKIARIL